MISATYNRRPYYRGDTILGWSVEIKKDGVPVDIASARLQLRAGVGMLVYDWPLTITGATVTMHDIPAEDSAKFQPIDLHYDLEVTLADGRVVTWLAGCQPIVADGTY